MSRLALIVIASVATTSAAQPALEWNHDAKPAPAHWVQYVDAKQGVRFFHPANAKVTSTATGLRVEDPGRVTLVITLSATNEPWARVRSGGHEGTAIEWRVEGPKRAARCRGDALTLDAATADSAICETLELALPPRRPHVEISIEATNIAGLPAVAAKFQALEPKLTACWAKQVARAPHISVGDLVLERALDGSLVQTTIRGRSNFFEGASTTPVDTEALGTCAFPLLEQVAVTATGKGKVVVTAACLWF